MFRETERLFLKKVTSNLILLVLVFSIVSVITPAAVSA